MTYIHLYILDFCKAETFRFGGRPCLFFSGKYIGNALRSGAAGSDLKKGSSQKRRHLLEIIIGCNGKDKAVVILAEIDIQDFFFCSFLFPSG